MMLLDEVTLLVERGHSLDFVKALDLLTLRSLADSSERVWKRQMRFVSRQQMISAQGTAKALKDLDKSLMEAEDLIAEDTNKFKRRFGG